MTNIELRSLKKKRKLTKEERKNYISLWKSSGLSRAAFCREEELSPSPFFSWIKTEEPNPHESGCFVPVVCNLNDASLLPAAEKQLKIQFSNGVIIEGCFKRNELALWLKEVRDGLSSLC
jgi:hypothetical protein